MTDLRAHRALVHRMRSAEGPGPGALGPSVQVPHEGRHVRRRCQGTQLLCRLLRLGLTAYHLQTSVLSACCASCCAHALDTLTPATCAQMTKYLVFYPDVPSFIASIQKRHDSLLEDIDTSEPEGAALRVRPCCCRRATAALFLRILAQR